MQSQKDAIIRWILNSPIVRLKIIVLFGRMVQRLFQSDFIEIEGRKMFVHNNDGLALSIFKVYEPDQTEIVKKVVRSGDIVIDVGAHVGYYTLLFAQIVGNKGKVYAFEPDPKNFQLLKKNVEVNEFQNVVLEQKAVSNKNGETQLFIDKENRAENRIYDARMNDTNESIQIKSIRLDDYFQDLEEEINFIKIDAEGSESGIFYGMDSIIKKNPNLKIITEYFPFLIKKFGLEPKKFIHILLDLGFQLYDILDKNKTNKPIDVNKFSENVRNEKYCTNIFCVKE
jgi:FkbM family methyltransferase